MVPLARAAYHLRLTPVLKDRQRDIKVRALKRAGPAAPVAVTRVLAVSETWAAQVGSPLVSHVFLHHTVEHKNKEAWDGKAKTNSI